MIYLMIPFSVTLNDP